MIEKRIEVLFKEADAALNDKTRFTWGSDFTNIGFHPFVMNNIPFNNIFFNLTILNIVLRSLKLKRIKKRFLKPAIEKQYAIDAALEQETNATEERVDYLKSINSVLKGVIKHLVDI